MITLYVLPSNTSARRAKEHLIQLGKPFVVRNMHAQKLSFEELKNILRYTENGVEDIIANGKVCKELEAQGVDFEEITLKEFHYYAMRYPKLIKAPIALEGDRLVIGYEERRYKVFSPRHLRTQKHTENVKQLREYESKKLANKKKISTGHWG